MSQGGRKKEPGDNRWAGNNGGGVTMNEYGRSAAFGAPPCESRKEYEEEEKGVCACVCALSCHWAKRGKKRLRREKVCRRQQVERVRRNLLTAACLTVCIVSSSLGTCFALFLSLLFYTTLFWPATAFHAFSFCFFRFNQMSQNYGTIRHASASMNENGSHSHRQSSSHDGDSPAKAPVVDQVHGDLRPAESDEATSPMSSRKALWAWLILCFSVSPPAPMPRITADAKGAKRLVLPVAWSTAMSQPVYKQPPMLSVTSPAQTSPAREGAPLIVS